MTPDWFRSPGWETADREEFEARLRRARATSRPQYLRIKALAVEPSDPSAAEELLGRVISGYTEDWPEVAFAHERLGDLRRRAGDQRSAEAHYREILQVSPALSGTTGEVHVKLGELLLERDGPTDEVFGLLEAARRHLQLNTSVFRWQTLMAMAPAARRDWATSAAAAELALGLLDAPPQFARPPTVGLANASPEVSAMLRGFVNRKTEVTRKGRRWSRRS